MKFNFNHNVVFKVVCFKKIFFPKCLVQSSDLFKWHKKLKIQGKEDVPTFPPPLPLPGQPAAAELRWDEKSSQIFHEGVSFNLLPAEVCLRCEVGLKCSDEWNQKQPLPQRFHCQTSFCSLHLKRLKNTSENSVYYCTCEMSNLCMSVCVRPSVCVCALLATWCGQLMYASMLVFLVCVIFHSRSLNLFWFLAALINPSNLEQVRLW